MQHGSKAIANYFIDRADGEGQDLTPMKLQKLIYFAHGWSLAIYGEPLIDEQVEAWKFGPVISSIYHEFKRFGSQPIKEPATEIELSEEGGSKFHSVVPKIKSSDIETKALLDKIWEIYRGYTAIQLSNATHLSGTPWEQVWGNGAVLKGTDIDEKRIKDYFVDLAKKSQPTETAQAAGSG